MPRAALGSGLPTHGAGTASNTTTQHGPSRPHLGCAAYISVQSLAVCALFALPCPSSELNDNDGPQQARRLEGLPLVLHHLVGERRHQLVRALQGEHGGAHQQCRGRAALGAARPRAWPDAGRGAHASQLMMIVPAGRNNTQPRSGRHATAGAVGRTACRTVGTNKRTAERGSRQRHEMQACLRLSALTARSGRDARTKRRMSITRWLWLKRATMREPSGRRSCSDVVGWASSTPCHSPLPAAAAAAAAAAATADTLLVDAPGPPSVRPEPVKYLLLARRHATTSSASGRVRASQAARVRPTRGPGRQAGKDAGSTHCFGFSASLYGSSLRTRLTVTCIIISTSSSSSVAVAPQVWRPHGTIPCRGHAARR
jgi:hypothetical protein